MFSRHITSFYTSILISIIILIMYMASCKKLERIDLYAGHYFVFDLTRGDINHGDIADIKVFSSNRDEIPLWLKRRNQTFLHGLPVRPCQVKLNVLLFCQLYMQNIKLCGSYVVNFHVGYDPHGVFNRIHPFQKQGTHLDSDKKHLDCESSKQNNVVIHTYVVCVSETKLLSKVVQISLRYIHPLRNIYVSTEYDFSEAVKQMKSLSISDVRQIDKKCDLLQMYVSFISTCSDHATTKHNRVRRNANDDVTSFTTSGVLSRQKRDQWKVFFGSISALVGTPTETSTRIASSMQTISTLFTSSPIESLSPSLVITFSFPTSSTTVSIHTYSTTSDTCNTIVTSHASILQNKTWTSTPNITSISFLSTSHDRISQPISASTFKSTHPSSKKGPSFSSYTSEFTNTKNIITSHAVTFSETLASFNLTTSDLTTLILSLTSQARTFSSVSQTRAFSSGSFVLSRTKSFIGSPLSSSEMQSTSLFIASYGRSSSTTDQTLRSLLRANSTIAIFPSQSILISTTYYLGANKTASVTAKMLSSEKQSYQTVMVTFTSVGILSQLSSVSFIRSIKTTHAISVSQSLNYSSVYLILSSSLPNSSITNVKPSNSTLSQIHSSMNSPKAPITSEISRFPKKTIIPSFVSTFTIHPYSTIPFSSYASTASFITLSPSKPVLKTVSEHLTDTRFSTYETVTSFRSLNQVTRRSTSTFSRSTNSKYLQSIESSRSDKIPTLSGTILSSITYSRIVDSLSPIKSTVNKILTTSRTILSSYFSDRKTSLPTSIIDSNILTSSGTSLSKTLTTFTTISSSFFRRTTGSFVNQTSVASAGKSIFSTSSSINTTRIISRTLGLSSLKSLPTISIDRSVISQNYISTNKKRNSETNSLPITVEKSTMMSHPVSIMSRRIGSSTILSSLKMIISKFATSTSSITSALNTMSVLPSFVTSPSYSPVFTQNFSSNFITNASLTVSTNPESTRNYSLYRSTVLESISNIPVSNISLFTEQIYTTDIFNITATRTTYSDSQFSKAFTKTKIVTSTWSSKIFSTKQTTVFSFSQTFTSIMSSDLSDRLPLSVTLLPSTSVYSTRLTSPVSSIRTAVLANESMYHSILNTRFTASSRINNSTVGNTRSKILKSTTFTVYSLTNFPRRQTSSKVNSKSMTFTSPVETSEKRASSRLDLTIIRSDNRQSTRFTTPMTILVTDMTSITSTELFLTLTKTILLQSTHTMNSFSQIFTISPSKSQLRIATPSTQISIPTLKTSALIASDSTFPLSVSASFDPSVFVSNIASTRTFFNTQKPSTDITVVVDSSLFTSSKPPNTLQITSLKIHPTTSYYNSTFSTTNNFSSKIIQSTEISRDVAPSTSTAVVMSLSMSLSKSLVVSVESLGQTSTLFLSPVSSQTMETKPQILSSSVNKNSDNTPTYLYATIPDLSITYPSSMDMISSSTATTSLSVSLKASSVSTTKILPTKVARTSKPTRVTQYSTSQSIQISRSLSTFHPISVNSTHSSKVTPVSFTPSTFSPPSSKTPTTPQPSSETPTTPTGTPNFKPVVVSPIGHQFAHAGRLFTYQISENTFKDFEDGNTRNLTLTASLFNGEDLKNSWLSFNSSSQRFSGIPLQPDFSDTKLNPLSIVVTAFDRFGKSVSDNFFIVISQPIRTLTFGVTVTLAIDFNVFKRHKELNVLFLQKLKEYFSIPSVEDLYISSIVNGSTKITWSETTSGIKTCNRSSTSNIFSMVQNPATNTPNVEFARFMLPLFPVIGIDTEYLGVCLVNTTPTPVITSSMGVPVSDGNSTTDSYLYYAIPIIILAVVVIVILLILAYFWRYRKKSDRKYKNPFFIPNKPVLFPDEIELQQVPITTKVVSDNLTNAAFEEDAFDGGSVVSNSNSDYSSYSSNYSHKEEPPPYMLPPAYVQRFFNTESDV